VGFLELQVLAGDASARRTVGVLGEWCADVRVGAGNVVYVRPDVASSLDDVAALTPLMISIAHLMRVQGDSALGQEHFNVQHREDAGGADVIDLHSGDMAFTALVVPDADWPHVMLHRAVPRRHSFSCAFTPLLERAFLVALRDAIRPLVPPHFWEPLDPAA